MAQPFIDPKTGMAYLRQRTPRDLLARLKGTKLTLPVGEGSETAVTIGEFVKCSLQTKDHRIGRSRHALANAALHRFWDEARSPSAIVAAEKLNAAARSGCPSGPAGGMSWDEALQRFGPGTADVLAEAGVPFTEANQAIVIAETARVFDEAFAMFRKEKLGETTAPSTKPVITLMARPEGLPPIIPNDATISTNTLWEKYQSKNADILATSTMHRYRASITRFIAFMPTKDVRSITDDDVYAWAEHRRDAEGISARTVNGNDLVALSSMFAWAQGREGGKILKDNPAKGVLLPVGRRKKLRERNFRDAEIEAILRAALAIGDDEAGDPIAQAKRWCPWLAAYSGARISELTALKAEDIRVEQGGWIMFFAETKNAEARSVPIHDHVIEQGFLEYVRSVRTGPLFYDPKRHAPDVRTPPWEIRSRKLAAWVRGKAKLDAAVDPNHGWRHTFKTIACSRMDDRIRDEIVGHAPGSVPRNYERPSIRMRAEALSKFPRYRV